MAGDFTKAGPVPLEVEVAIDRQPCELSVEEYVVMARTLDEAKQRIREFMVS
jgi:hypothetical protein